MRFLDYIKETIRLNREYYQTENDQDAEVPEDPESDKAPPGYVDTGERINGIPVYHKIKESMSYADKERILVERITAMDMLQFGGMPYNLNCPIKKETGPNVHAVAYMDLAFENIVIAKAELQKLNVVIDYARKKIPVIPKWARIDISKIAFQEYNARYGYTHLICTPLTFTGKVQKIPLKLYFVSKRREDGLGYEVNGEIKYLANGQIASATVNCWYRRSRERAGDGWQYIFYNNDGDLTMKEILSTARSDEYGRPTSVYKCPEFLEEERQRAADYKTYEWLKVNLPDLCPKSASAYRTMKTRNSKGYQKIVEAALELGKQL